MHRTVKDVNEILNSHCLTCVKFTTSVAFLVTDYKNDVLVELLGNIHAFFDQVFGPLVFVYVLLG